MPTVNFNSYFFASALEYGAAGDGSTDDSSSIQSAIDAVNTAGGGVIYFPRGTYSVTSALTMYSNVTLKGEGDASLINWDSTAAGKLMDLTGLSNVIIENLKIDGKESTAASDTFIDMTNSTNCKISNCTFVNLPSAASGGSISLLGTASDNIIEDCSFTDCENISILLSGAAGSTKVEKNTIRNNLFTDSGSFGIKLEGGSERNEISGNKTKSNALELIGLTFNAEFNRIIGNHAEGTGDNGISVSGDHNLVVGNHCQDNDNAGIWLWGSYNTCTGNICINNNQDATNPWAGIGSSANFGGAGQYNTIVGNTTDDTQSSPTQDSNIRLGGNGYTEWASSQSITANGSADAYRYYGLNIYIATTSGTTGATPPTHTSGTVSDGAVSWRYVNSFVTSTNQNVIAWPNSLGRFKNSNFVTGAFPNIIGDYDAVRMPENMTIYGAAPQLIGSGSGTNVDLLVSAKGSGVIKLGHKLDTNGKNIIIDDTGVIEDDSNNEYIIFSKAASAVNEITVANAATGNSPSIAATGGDSNINLNLSPKGTGNVVMSDGTDTTKAVSVEVSGATTGKTATLTHSHTDNRTITFPDASDTLVARDTTDTLTNKTINTASNTITVVEADISDLQSYLVNVVEDTNPQLGGNLDVNGFNIRLDNNKGLTDDSGNETLITKKVTSAVNYATLSNNSTGNPVIIGAGGGDTNIDISFTPKGSGVMQFGTHSAIGAETVTGYITIKDSSGTTRKLAVVS